MFTILKSMGNINVMAIAKNQNRRQQDSKRMSRDDWLEKSLEIVARQGPSHLRIDEISEALGVTKGSFYHHFSGRSEWLNAIADYWYEHYNRAPVAEVDGSAADQLWTLMAEILEVNAAKYDIAIRSWAFSDPRIDRIVMRADKFRLKVVTSLFTDLGFSGAELEARANAFKATMETESVRFHAKPQDEREQYLRALFEFFTAR